MPPGQRNDDHGLYNIVFALFIVLALTIGWFGYKRYFAGGARRAPRSAPAVRVEQGRPGETDRAPSVIPGVKLAPASGYRAAPKRKSVPPAIPQPPAAPDRE